MRNQRPAALSELQKQAVLEKLWLHYYNDTLLDKGVITSTEHRKMKNKINCRPKGMER